MRLLVFTLSFCCAFLLSAQKKAPDFTVTNVEGQEISLYKDYLEKGKVVVIELFFVDCPPCNTLAPFMGPLYEQWGSGAGQVEFINLSDKNWDNNQNVLGFKQKYKHNWQFVSPEGGSLQAAKVYEDGTYGAFWGTPTTIVIAPDGTVNYNVRASSLNAAWTAKVSEAITQAIPPVVVDIAPTPTAIVTGNISSLKNQGIGNATLRFTGGKDTTIVSKPDGTFSTGNLPRDSQYIVTIEKDIADMNGVTTADIVLMSKHILGIDTFKTQYQLLAADVNNSGKVTSFDMVQVRQLILGIFDEFPNNSSWRFDPNQMSLDSLGNLGQLTFVGYKIGDVNYSADPSALVESETRSTNGTFDLKANDQYFKKGDLINVDFSANDLSQVLGFQFTLDFNAQRLQFMDLKPNQKIELDKSHFNLNLVNRGLLSASWFNLKPQSEQDLFTLTFKAKEAGNLKDLLSVSSDITRAEAYNQQEEILDVALNFENTPTTLTERATLLANPIVNQNLNLNLELKESQQVQLTIMNIEGKTLFTQVWQGQKGIQQLNLTAPNLVEGAYFLNVQTENGFKQTLKFVRLRE